MSIKNETKEGNVFEKHSMHHTTEKDSTIKSHPMIMHSFLPLCFNSSTLLYKVQYAELHIKV